MRDIGQTEEATLLGLLGELGGGTPIGRASGLTRNQKGDKLERLKRLFLACAASRGGVSLARGSGIRICGLQGR